LRLSLWGFDTTPEEARVINIIERKRRMRGCGVGIRRESGGRKIDWGRIRTEEEERSLRRGLLYGSSFIGRSDGKR
jgi:hypothetical protein